MNSNYLLVPGAIILGGLILAGAIFFVRQNAPETIPGDPTVVRPVSPSDHIIGSPTAPVVIIEYSDIDCPYCKQFQQTMAQIMTEIGADGKVAWVYRHLPLTQIHPNAARHAEASECVASLGGENSFWRFIDALQAAAPDQNQFNPANYGGVVTSLGISESSFEACLSSGQFKTRVDEDMKNGIAAGATGTPYLVIQVEGNDPIPVSGALPYAAMKEVIAEALAKVP
jgi:protein-disulfide isomerase